ncbi:hypothetical protein HY994_06810 [Candidatus Micrarchaeota archaeon]|nr:hypothetical protein [Candidatus Micrarchaeota archaeon]
MRETPFRTARRAIEIPIRHFAYFYANEDPQPMRDLAAAIENGDAEKTRELLSESQRNLNQQITEKQLRQATQMQHSQRARAVQELVQNSMDAYGPEGGSMQYRQYEDPKRGRVFEFKDQAGGLSAEDFIGLLMTVGASQKKGNAVGGHGQGFKAMLGVGNVLHATSRNLHGELVQKGHEYVARFNKNEHYVPGLDVMAEGIDGQLDFHQALTGFCSHVEPHFPIMHQTDTPDGMVEKQINQVQRAGNPNFAHIGNVGGIRVYAEPTVSESNHTTWLQKGMLINRMYENQPLNIYLDMPGGSKYLLERGRDVVPESIEKSARKQLKPMIRRYAQRLLEKEHLTPAEISFLRRASPMGQKILKFAAATAGLAAAGYAASWLSLASGAETKLGGLQIDGAQAPPLPHAEMDAPEVPEKPLEFPTTEEGRRGLAMGSLITGLGAGPLYQYLVSRQEQGKSNTFPILVRDAVAALWTKYRGDVPFLIRRMPILPAIEAKKAKSVKRKSAWFMRNGPTTAER